MKIRGRVVEGDGRGRTLGYPTANIAVPDGFDWGDGFAGFDGFAGSAGFAAANGVYAARVCFEGRSYDAMANLGVKPTFSDRGCGGSNDGSNGGSGGSDGGSGNGDNGGGNGVQGGKRVLELHLFDFEGDLYGREVTVELREFIRPERRFPTPEALRTQIADDEKQIKNILKCI